MAEAALSDVRILDLTHYIAGPYCTKLLADLGADVVKIERPGTGDATRRMGPFPGDEPHPEKSGLFLHLNTNKRGITLNLKSATGKRLFRELVKEVDILVESFAPRVMPSLGLDYAALEKSNPRLVMVSISNFGQTGPYRDYKAEEILIYAMGGAMNATGIAEREPLKLGENVMQFQAGSVAAVATMGALFVSRLQGLGQHVDLSLMETQLGTIDRRRVNLVSYSYSRGAPYVRGYGEGTGILPGGVLPCADGFVQVSGQLRWWNRWAKMLDMPELAQDPRFQSEADFFNPERKADIDAIIVPWLMEHGKQWVMEKAQAAGLAFTAVNTIADIVNDRHLQEREYWVETDHPAAGRVRLPGAPYKMQQSPWQLRRPAPTLGQHNIEVYGQLGYTRADLVRLREAGVI